MIGRTTSITMTMAIQKTAWRVVIGRGFFDPQKDSHKKHEKTQKGIACSSACIPKSFSVPFCAFRGCKKLIIRIEFRIKRSDVLVELPDVRRPARRSSD